MKMRIQKKYLFWALLVLLTVVLVYFFWYRIIGLVYNFSKLKEMVVGLGALGPLFLIILQILQVFFAPVPGQVTGFLAGYLYGPWLGTIYAMFGIMIGSWLVIKLARKFGRPFVEKLVSPTKLQKFDKLAEEKGLFAFFLLWLLPALPDDLICFVAGFTSIRIGLLLPAVFLGRLPGFLVLSLWGSGVASSDLFTVFITIAFAILGSALFLIFRKKIEEFTMRFVEKKKVCD